MARIQMQQQSATTAFVGVKSVDKGLQATAPKSAAQLAVEPDDRFPGSFFRIPGRPFPGRTTWSVVE